MNDTQENKFICEICGEPATIMITDTEPNFESRKIGINAKQPHGKPHFYCNKHKRESIHHEAY